MPEGALSPARDGVYVAIRLTPRGKENRILGLVVATEGKAAVKAIVAAPPIDGRANEALLTLLARSWGLPRRELTITAGAKGREKRVHVAGDPQALMARLRAIIGKLGATG